METSIMPKRVRPRWGVGMLNDFPRITFFVLNNVGMKVCPILVLFLPHNVACQIPCDFGHRRHIWLVRPPSELTNSHAQIGRCWVGTCGIVWGVRVKGTMLRPQ